MSDPHSGVRSVAIHASAVCANSQALIFLGPSGTGKSTMCHLLDKYTQTLALDAVYLVFRGYEWKVLRGDGIAHGKPLPEERANSSEGVSLRAIVRLHQTTDPSLEPIDALQTCRYLTDALFEIIRQREDNFETKRFAFSCLATIARRVPGYQFHFDLSIRTPEILNKTIDLW
jgi:ABC-type dipeptide/oligopeptide/nickel transport system ATPase subunit